MAYRKVIEINPLSKKSIDKAIRELREEKKRQEKLIDDFMDKLATEVTNIILSRFLEASGRGWNSNVTTPTFRREGHNRIIHAGGEQIAFLEFGAGAEAGPGVFPTIGNVTADFTPGSWSAEHGRTYQAWEAGGYVGMYPYEQPPARGFDTAIAELPYLIKKCADEVFK